jgi:xanthine dehydrogenase accessory factor
MRFVSSHRIHMDNVDLNVLKTIVTWRAEGRRVTMGTIVRTWGSAPRPVGAIVAIGEDAAGQTSIAGSVSGGCIEDDLVDKVRASHGQAHGQPHGQPFALAKPERLKYGISAEEANRFGLPCGGTIELVMEPIGDQSRVEELADAIAQGHRVRRTLDLEAGAVTLDGADAFDRHGESLTLTDRTMATLHGPSWRLLIIGAGQMTQYLAQIAQALDYRVIVCDPREEYSAQWQVAGSELTTEMPDDAVIAMKPDAHTAVVALTHDPKLDDLALMEALKGDAFYVGAIGSKKNQEKRRARLLEFDVSEDQIARLHGPVGLKNGARTPPEIAVAILAEMTAVRYGYRIPEPVRL